ncbi:50S ribosomal protein L6 [Planctomycetales bacterium 10988]|nr:50S ribosomal protein L6 [Planctomycetales bacterium 10988]
MSRIGKLPVPVEDGVNVTVQDKTIAVEGKLGKIDFNFRPEIDVEYDAESKQIKVTRQDDERLSKALHGVTRALISNMVEGVTKGFEKRLEIVGVGYLAAVDGNTLQLRVGFANEVHMPIPEGLTVTCPDQTHVSIKGVDKQLVGQFAAAARSVRKPEPYKGKGIRYEGEQIRKKDGKASAK